MPTYQWYRTGTITLTQGSDIVTGVGTTFLTSGVTFGEILVVEANGEQNLLEIVGVDNNTQIRIATPWSPTTESSLAFFVISSITGTHNHELILKIEALLNYRTTSQEEMVLWAGGNVIGVPTNNKFSNGDFDLGLDDWTVNTTDPLTTYDTTNDRLEMRRLLGSQEPWVQQTATTVIGNTYVILVDVDYGSTHNWRFEVNGVVVKANAPIVLGKTTVSFVAASTSSTVRIVSSGSTSSVLILDNITVGDPSNGLYPFLRAESGTFVWVPCPAKIAADYTGSLRSAYQEWLYAGNTGTEADFLASLQGETGSEATLAVGSVSSVPFGAGSTVTNVGTLLNAVFDFEIEQGVSATVELGTISTGAPGTSVIIENVGTTLDAIWNITIPRGASGFGIPAGGAINQVLKKASGSDYDFVWGYPVNLVDWADVENTPTTLAGYGITNAYTKSQSDGRYAPAAHVHSGEDGSGRTEATIDQTAHGFSVLDCICHNGSSWIKAQADDPTTTSFACVVEVKDADKFVMAICGRYTMAAQHGLSTGEWYYLSDSTPGGLAIGIPDGIQQPVLFVESINTVIIYQYRPSALSFFGGALGHSHSEDDIYDLDKYTKAEVDALLEGATGYAEAPLDGNYYARRNGGWYVFLPWQEAPNDGKTYGRKNGAWNELTAAATIGGDYLEFTIGIGEDYETLPDALDHMQANPSIFAPDIVVMLDGLGDYSFLDTYTFNTALNYKLHITNMSLSYATLIIEGATLYVDNCNLSNTAVEVATGAIAYFGSLVENAWPEGGFNQNSFLVSEASTLYMYDHYTGYLEVWDASIVNVYNDISAIYTTIIIDTGSSINISGNLIFLDGTSTFEVNNNSTAVLQGGIVGTQTLTDYRVFAHSGSTISANYCECLYDPEPAGTPNSQGAVIYLVTP